MGILIYSVCYRHDTSSSMECRNVVNVYAR